jgi:sigma-B regulation protein RsbU (phosphoserine phosphatase)
MFATIFCGRIDLTNGLLTYSNGGHEPPLIISDDGTVKLLQGTGCAAVGFDPELKYKNETYQLSHGDIVCLYTDGVTEAFNIHNTMYTRERVEKWIKGREIPSAKDLVESLYSEIKKFSEGSTRGDDITILAVKYH